jgi:lactoylglutathione lyase
MQIEHIALWTRDLEALRTFYIQHFGATSGPLYHNPAKGFRSYFLSFTSGAHLEIMTQENLAAPAQASLGYAHLAFSVGSVDNVRATTERLRLAGVVILGEPRTTGDGYFESLVADPEGNRIEITV